MWDWGIPVGSEVAGFASISEFFLWKDLEPTYSARANINVLSHYSESGIILL